ncbi:hypothetical protein BPO_1375 [Bergeyella porcorum]|uniref:Mur ligase central domain-containing protein n=1 Tax=Bergeyella porcorum TaxID=1735111 RepID=A0AAU0F1G7_9FLAO
MTEAADYFSDNLKMEGDQISFDFHLPNSEIHRFSWEIPGIHNVENATGALAVLHNLGVEIEVLKKALANFKALKDAIPSIHFLTERFILMTMPIIQRSSMP